MKHIFAPGSIEYHKRRQRYQLIKWLVIFFLVACFLSGIVRGFI